MEEIKGISQITTTETTIPTTDTESKICSKCGAILTVDQAFCSKCGKKVEDDLNANDINSKKRKGKKIYVILPLVALFIISVIVLMSVINADTATYIKWGKYEKAWSIAKTDEDRLLVIEALLNEKDFDGALEKASSDSEKEVIINAYLSNADYDAALSLTNDSSLKKVIECENLVSCLCTIPAEFYENLPSFSLQSAWYNAETQHSVLLVSVDDPFGKPILFYHLFTQDNDTLEWSEFGIYQNLEKDNNEYSDIADILTKIFYNRGISYMEDTVLSENELPEESLNRINNVIEQKLLDKTKLLPSLGVIKSE